MSFRFKQFYVEDNGCAMKVGTDGVLLGAWTPIGCPQTTRKVLDIGTGSGLIALMIAQRSPDTYIVGIDIDADAVQQSRYNFASSPWSNRLEARHISLQKMAQTTERFNLIVSNPPYFQNSLKAPDPQRSLARHTDTLDYNQLFHCANQLLCPQGSLSLILPAAEEHTILQLSEQFALYPHQICRIRGRAYKSFKRIMLNFRHDKPPKTIQEQILTLETGNNQRTDAYQALAHDFYL